MLEQIRKAGCYLRKFVVLVFLFEFTFKSEKLRNVFFVSIVRRL